MLLIKLMILTLILGWIFLYLNSSAILIHESLIKSEKEDGQASLDCKYFTGTSTFIKQFWQSPNGFMGKPACPKIVSFGEE